MNDKRPTLRHVAQFRFSIRALLGVMFLLAVILGIWAEFVRPYRKMLLAKRALERQGGQVTLVGENGPGWQRWLVTKTIGPDGFTRVTNIDLRGAKTDPTTARHLHWMPTARTVTLDGCEFSDSELRALSHFAELRLLSLRYTQVGDAGIESICQLPSLTTLYITGTNVTDTGLRFLKNAKSLDQVFARWTTISQTAADEFCEAVPACQIHTHEQRAQIR
jgi:hypothetical protein